MSAVASAPRTTIAAVDAWWVMDSRGTPTVRARVVLSDGAAGEASAPSGASTGTHEALELRDAGPAWGGRGVDRAVSHVRGEIAGAVVGHPVNDEGHLVALDAMLRGVDGTPGLSRLGANAVLPVSAAAALALADSRRVPLWRLWTDRPLLPMPMINIVSGGAHAGRVLDIQDVLVVPVAAESVAEALQTAWRVRAATAEVAASWGVPTSLVADEGGLAGPPGANRRALELVTRGIETAGLRPGDDVALALDVAATQFAAGPDQYVLATEGRALTSEGLIDEIAGWCRDFPVVSVEDPLAEDDWDGWRRVTARLPGVQLVGDDLFVTDVGRVARGGREAVASAVLVKVNQTGTLSGARDVLGVARSQGYRSIVSARSGETEDSWLADLAVGWRAGQIKVGSTMRGERTAKWNRLLSIAHDHPDAQFAGWPPQDGEPSPPRV